MPGDSTATQSSRCGSRPNEPERVMATMRATFALVLNVLYGRRILSCMRCNLRSRSRGLGGPCRTSCGRSARFSDRTNHVKRALWKVLELIAQNALTSVERVLQADGFSGHAAELLGCEEWLGEKSLQPPRASHDVAISLR